MKSAWAAWENKGERAQIAQSEETETVRVLKLKQEAEQKAATEKRDAERESSALEAVKPGPLPPVFDWPQARPCWMHR